MSTYFRCFSLRSDTNLIKTLVQYNTHAQDKTSVELYFHTEQKVATKGKELAQF